MVNNECPKNLLESIASLASFSYKPAIKKHRFVKKYLKGDKNPRLTWALLVTATGAGSVLLTKEEYPGGHDEMREAIELTPGLSEIVIEYMNFATAMYEKEELLYKAAIGCWVIRQIMGEKFPAKANKKVTNQIFEINETVGKLLSLVIEDYVKDKIEHGAK
jgi:hypothetical protein